MTAPPLDPSGDQARALLREELAKPQYLRSDLPQRIMRWLDRLVSHTTGAVSHVPLLTTLATVVVVVALLVAVLLVASRARRSARSAAADRAVLPDRNTTAAELRALAESHLAGGRYDDALVDAFRALARRQIERDTIEDVPQATAHEIVRAIAASGRVAPALGAETAHAADLFDAVLYGDHPATRDQAAGVLLLDERLAGRAVAR